MAKPILAMFDDFFPNPGKVFDAVSGGEFSSYKSIWDGVTYPGINKEIPSWATIFIFNRLEQILGTRVKGICFARAMLEGMIAPHRIHSDKIMGDYSMHIYLSRDWPSESGTSFWEHKTEGKSHTDQTDLAEIERASNDLSVWSRDLLMCAKFNRAVIHDASLFHAAEPREGFGEDPKTGRLVLTTFFSEVK